VLIVITGPIASGKSTLARRVAAELEERGRSTAVIDVDVLYDMLQHDRAVQDGTARWRAARNAAAVLAGSFARDGIEVVIIEDDLGTPTERADLLGSLPSEALVVTLRVGYETALLRARADPSRGVSRDPAFLRPYYTARSTLLEMAGDLAIDTEATTVADAAHLITERVTARLSG
jgi:chloramphenicol 3-O-phosphotransferase